MDLVGHHPSDLVFSLQSFGPSFASILSVGTSRSNVITSQLLVRASSSSCRAEMDAGAAPSAAAGPLAREILLMFSSLFFVFCSVY